MAKVAALPFARHLGPKDNYVSTSLYTEFGPHKGVQAEVDSSLAEVFDGLANQVRAARERWPKKQGFEKHVEKSLGTYFGAVMASHFVSQEDSRGNKWARLSPNTLKRKIFLKGKTAIRLEELGKRAMERRVSRFEGELHDAAVTGDQDLIEKRTRALNREQVKVGTGFQVKRRQKQVKVDWLWYKRKTVMIHMPRSAKQLERFSKITKREAADTRHNYHTTTRIIFPLVESGAMFRAATASSSATMSYRNPSTNSLGLDVDATGNRFLLKAHITSAINGRDKPGETQENAEGKFFAHNRPRGAKLATGIGGSAKIPGREFFYLKREDADFLEAVLLESLYKGDPSDLPFGGGITTLGAAALWSSTKGAGIREEHTKLFESMLDARTKAFLEESGAVDIVRSVFGAEKAYRRRHPR